MKRHSIAIILCACSVSAQVLSVLNMGEQYTRCTEAQEIERDMIEGTAMKKFIVSIVFFVQMTTFCAMIVFLIFPSSVNFFLPSFFFQNQSLTTLRRYSKYSLPVL